MVDFNSGAIIFSYQLNARFTKNSVLLAAKAQARKKSVDSLTHFVVLQMGTCHDTTSKVHHQFPRLELLGLAVSAGPISQPNSFGPMI
ncbi:Coatomer subunit beta' [Fusarium oxysporum f. sp. albedinis]|nr:Uncharacterized protein HZ326_21652 [Fusarium oxysporum f. sp. albedinis]KAJ0136186.1 Coatomer subunit beta' [Fusarium oxysporum f. sp. albedinis]